MAKKVIVSPQFSLQWRDALKGLLVSTITSVLIVVQQTIEAGSLTFNWKQIGIAAVGSAVAYLLKNFFAPASVITTYKTNDKALEAAEDIKK